MHEWDGLFARQRRRAHTSVIACSTVALLSLGACKSNKEISKTVVPPGGFPTGAARSGVLPPEDGQWMMPGKNYGLTRFSGLAEITTANVSKLQEIATFSTGVLRGQESAPLVVGSTMYIVTPYPNIVYALDMTQPGWPTKWVYQPRVSAASQGVACCDVVNRGVTYDQGKIFLNTLDVSTIALDANTGKELWRTQLGDINKGETVTMAPFVVKNRVLVGVSGGEMGVRGWVKGLDESSGKVVWTAYGTGPDKDVLIGPNFHPFYAKDRGTDLGVKTWVGDEWKIGGGGMWGWIAYDPDLDLVYYGTANPGPWNPDQRPGDNKWTVTLFARHPETGEAIWGYQVGEHDQWDYDGINESVLADIPWQGKTRKVLMRAERNGYLYVIDRTNGEVLSADPYANVNTTTGVDMSTGKMGVNEAKVPRTQQTVREMCPAAPGGKDWQPMSFSPKTGLLYIPHQNLCMDEEATQANYIAGTPYVGMNAKFYAGPGGNRGELTAWDPVARHAAWVVKEDFPVWSGTVVTAGDVVFYGTMDGWFKAVDAHSGAPLWKHKVSSGIISQPTTFKGPDGKQYVAVLDGVGGWAGAVVAGDLDTKDSTAALGFAYANRDLPMKSTKGGTLHVFALP